jgi:hypothetical protein
MSITRLIGFVRSAVSVLSVVLRYNGGRLRAYCTEVPDRQRVQSY